MNPSKFDELTKQLAKSTSRRHALKTILTASVGGVVGLGAIRSVFGSNAFCDQWCHAVFGNTRAAGQCTSDAAHHRGLCVTCGNVAPANICCIRDSNGFCIGGTVTAGCACDSSQCQTCDTSTGTCVGCPPGETCENGQCTTSCTGGVCGTYTTCDNNDNCACGTTTEGGSACFANTVCGTQCNASSDCPAGSICLTGSCCGFNLCVPLCGTDAPEAPTGSGPTATGR
jgi:hypothetical protein